MSARQFWSLIKSAVRGDAHDFTSGSIRRAIVLLAVPMMLEMAMESVFALVDTFFVGRIGVEALTTVGLTEVMMTLIYSIGVGLSLAPMALIARFVGEKKPDEASRAAGQSIVITLILSLVVSVPAVYYAGDLLALMGAGPAVIAEGIWYTRILFAGNGVIMLLFLLNGVFRGAGEAATAMRVLWIANGINVFLDPLFIFGLGPIPGFGVAGAAIATTIGRAIGVGYQLYILFSGRSVVRIKTGGWKIDPIMQLRVLRIASNGAFQYIIGSASWIFLARIVASFGASAVAGYTVSIRLILFTLLPAWGLSNAAATFVGQNLGAKQPDRAERGVWWTLGITTVYLLLLSFGYYFFAGPLVQSFTQDPEAVGYGVDALKIFAIGYVIFGLGLIPVQAFNGAGDTGTPTLLNFVCFWLLEIPLSYYLAVELGFAVRGVIWSVVIAELLLAVVALWLFRRGKWKLKEI
ncbi:putative MATE family efflux protein [Neolewinella xylanilytica]|uniref:Multidrug-efflux transporter n=1 Tax=Neolewinella xylanilytica TaxID=1514080 RepID=A0A2S6I2H6_9BACT|nr:MATE family efflux transporter [Neolewinella xylanilytica]PPK85384.1 putative MATE family efflux protein [Neolewinella xylanilytica]